MNATEEQLEAVVEFVNAEAGTAEFDQTVARLMDLDVPPDQALQLFEWLVDTGQVVTLCEGHDGREPRAAQAVARREA